jgi:hypothetical protein
MNGRLPARAREAATPQRGGGVVAATGVGGAPWVTWRGTRATSSDTLATLLDDE